MANLGHIVVPSNQRVPRETHVHKCPFKYCRAKFVTENNVVCQKVLAGTGLSHHTFPCMNHLADARQRFGLDWILDAMIDDEQARRFRKEWPDRNVERREVVEARTNPEVAATLPEPKRA